MTFITENWRRYFDEQDEGLGTTYERFILHRYFEKLRQEYVIQSVLETPSFGMTGVSGINSLWWASQRIDVTVIDNVEERLRLVEKVWEEVSLKANFVLIKDGHRSLPFMDRSFDMSWNFASLWLVPDLNIYLRELARVTKRVIFICVPNTANISSFISTSLLGDNRGANNSKRTAELQSIITNLGWDLQDHGYFDVPPWPDIAMKKEDLLRKIGLTRIAHSLENRKQVPLCILDYFSGRNPRMEADILKYSFLENGPSLLKRFWAHHQYYVFTNFTK